MENTLYKITLSNGYVLDNLTLNGNNFISEQEITDDMFTGNCASVTIEHEESGETIVENHENMRLVQISKMGDTWWFILDDISESEMENIKMKSDIAYVAMMTGVDL